MKYEKPVKCKCGTELWTSKAVKHHKCRFTIEEQPAPMVPPNGPSPKTH